MDPDIVAELDRLSGDEENLDEEDEMPDDFISKLILEESCSDNKDKVDESEGRIKNWRRVINEENAEMPPLEYLGDEYSKNFMTKRFVIDLIKKEM